jgi:hypothetical protein
MAIGGQVGKIFSVPQAKVANPTVLLQLTAQTTGTMALTTYYVTYTFTTADGGETAPRAEQSITLSGAQNSIRVDLGSSYYPANATGINVYMGTVSGLTSYQGSVTTIGQGLVINSLSLSGKAVPTYNKTSWQDINPSTIGLTTGSEFIIHNIYYSDAMAMAITNGTDQVVYDGDTNNGARMGTTIHCNGNQWLRVFNTNVSNLLYVTFDGIQTV